MLKRYIAAPGGELELAAGAPAGAGAGHERGRERVADPALPG